MKKPLYLRSAGCCLFLVLLSLSCRDNVQLRQTEQEPSFVEAPEQIISVEQAQGMYKNYSERRSPLISRYEDSINVSKRDTAQFNVARYVYYDYATIKQYLAYIEQEAKSAGVSISTLRFYLANYPDQESFADGRPVKHPRQNSIMMLPTLNQGGEEYGFYIGENGEGKPVAMLLNGQLQPYYPEGMGSNAASSAKAYAGMLPEPASAAHSVLQGGKSTILNEGTGAPPPWN
jgi:hypothetical protein